MRLFDDIERTITRPKNYNESRFEYLNRSARKDYSKIRDLLEGWFNHYPSAHQEDLQSRFRGDDQEHIGAFYELYLHELLTSLDYERTIHPEMEDVSTHPDFKVTTDKQTFYLEATIAAQSEQEIAEEARKNQVYDVLNRMDSPNFFVGLDIQGNPETTPPGSDLRKCVKEKFSDLDPDKISEKYEEDNREALPEWNWKHEDWKVTFFPIPKKPEFRGETESRPIASKIEGGFFIPDVGIKRSIKDKASKYGDLDIPYIIAVNTWNKFGAGEFEVMNALFGELQVNIRVYEGDRDSESSTQRKPNGAWIGPKGPRNRRVSGLLFANNLNPWNVSRQTPILWHNPWAKKELNEKVWPFPQNIPSEKSGEYQLKDGLENHKVLDIYPGWPV